MDAHDDYRVCGEPAKHKPLGQLVAEVRFEIKKEGIEGM